MTQKDTYTGPDDGSADPIGVLECLVTRLPPDQLEQAIDVLRKVTRAYVKQARRSNMSLAHVEAEVTGVFERASPAISDSLRAAILERLMQTCRVWYL